MIKRFEGETAVVTGGASGIGYAISEKLAQEGAQIWILDRDIELTKRAVNKLQKKGSFINFIIVDITKEDEVQSA